MTKEEKNLYAAFLTLKTPTEVASFLRDLMTEAEIAEFSMRFEIARQLDAGKSYRDIADLVKTSTTTVTRVSQWLTRGKGGYRLVLDRLNSQQHHTRTPLVQKRSR